jgi:hypothetical protein
VVTPLYPTVFDLRLSFTSYKRETMLLNEYKQKEHFQKEHEFLFSKNQIDWFIRQRTINGLNDSGALMKISNKWYIHTDKFTQWFSSHNS